MRKKLFFLAAMTAAAGANAQETMWVDGKECVDLGLSVYWATCNVGADTPEEVGDHFAWGETEPKTKYEHLNYTFDKYPETLDAEYDVATQKWGENWRMPTITELEELIWPNCSKTWNEEKNGYKIKSQKNENSIFLPATGYKNMDNEYGLKIGYYLSSTKGDDELYSYTSYCKFIMIEQYRDIRTSSFYRYQGFAVRPVCEKKAYTKLNYVEKDNANTVYKTFENGQIVIVKNGVKYNLRGQKL